MGISITNMKEPLNYHEFKKNTIIKPLLTEGHRQENKKENKN